MLRLLIDPGHGGKDRGAGLVEADINIEVASVLEEAIEDLRWPVSVALTHDGSGATLRERRLTEGEFGADFVLSLHCNAADAQAARGLMAFFWPSNRYGQLVAQQIGRCAPAGLYRDRGSSYAAHRETWPRVRNVLGSFVAPAVLVEMGFLTNDTDRSLLKSARVRRELIACLLSGVARALTLDTKER